MSSLYSPALNLLMEICMVSAGIGGAIGILLISYFHADSKYSNLIIYGLFLLLYFQIEFSFTYLFNPTRVTSKSFLIYGNRGNLQFWAMQTFAVWEYLVHRSSIISFVTNCFLDNQVIPRIGIAMIVSGLIIRAWAIQTCGSSFSHLIETENRRKDHVLVTSGIYSILRHPSYFGFWCFAIGAQLLCINWLNLIANIVILAHFFTVRIEFEEYFLIHKLFHEEYVEYKKKVGVWIPFVRIKDNI